MQERVNYDPVEDVVWIDLSNLSLTDEIIDSFVAVVLALTVTISHKVYALVNWHNTHIPLELADYYGQESAKVASHFLGLLRYAVSDPYANVTIRMQTLRNHVAGASAHIYVSKEAALDAVHLFRKSSPSATTTLTTVSLPTSGVIPDPRHAVLDTEKPIANPIPPQLTRATSQPYYDDAFITVSWVMEWQCVVVIWKKFAEGEKYRYCLNKILELFQLKVGMLFLSDSRLQGVISNADQTWTNQEWGPQLAKTGLKKSAVILPDKAVTQMSLNRMVRTRSTTFQTAFFSSIEEAITWLLQKTDN
jgi:hypothetical protein